MLNRKNKPNEFALGIFLLTSLGIAVGSLILFGWLAEQVLRGDTTQFDATIRSAVHNHAHAATHQHHAGIFISWLWQIFGSCLSARS